MLTFEKREDADVAECVNVQGHRDCLPIYDVDRMIVPIRNDLVALADFTRPSKCDSAALSAPADLGSMLNELLSAPE